MLIYHIATMADWAAAEASGSYTISTKDRTLEQEGFIHASQGEQVAAVADLFYAGEDGLILLAVDTDRLAAEVRYEPVPGWDLPFPHIYGPINPDAVIDVLPLPRGADGKFHFSPDQGLDPQ
jgi:glutathione S-transferase